MSTDEFTQQERQACRDALFAAPEPIDREAAYRAGFKAALRWMRQQPTLETRLITLLKNDRQVSLGGTGDDQTWEATAFMVGDDPYGGREDVSSDDNEPSPSAAIDRLETRLQEWEAKHGR
jgi:hypothetical protein